MVIFLNFFILVHFSSKVIAHLDLTTLSLSTIIFKNNLKNLFCDWIIYCNKICSFYKTTNICLNHRYVPFLQNLTYILEDIFSHLFTFTIQTVYVLIISRIRIKKTHLLEKKMFVLLVNDLSVLINSVSFDKKNRCYFKTASKIYWKMLFFCLPIWQVLF